MASALIAQLSAVTTFLFTSSEMIERLVVLLTERWSLVLTVATAADYQDLAAVLKPSTNTPHTKQSDGTGAKSRCGIFFCECLTPALRSPS